MKRIFAVFVSAICFCICYQASAQNDVYLVASPQTARWSYIETDSKGKHVLTVYNSIEAVEGDGVNGSIKLRVEEVPVASPKDTIKSFMFYRFKDGEFVADLSAGLEDTMFEGKLDSSIRGMIDEKYPDLPEEKKKEVLEQARAEFIKITGEVRGIPRYPEVGKLPDYESHVKITMMSMKVIGADRRIVGRESIQTGAGLYD